MPFFKVKNTSTQLTFGVSIQWSLVTTSATSTCEQISVMLGRAGGLGGVTWVGSSVASSWWVDAVCGWRAHWQRPHRLLPQDGTRDALLACFYSETSERFGYFQTITLFLCLFVCF